MNDTKLNELSQLAHLLVQAEADIDNAETQLKHLKENARRLREESIPSAMQELELTSVTLSSGEKVKVGLEVYAAIPQASRDEAFDWLTTNGFDGIIKTEVSMNFGRGELQRATQLAQQLRAAGHEASLTQNVHPQTLKAFLKEQLGAARPVPLDLFGARPVMTAKVTTK